MAKKALQINFKYNVSAADYARAVTPLAGEIAKVKGFLWKVWVLNEAEKESGGFYLFEDEASLQAFLEGPIVAQVQSNPALSDISAKVFDIMEEQSTVTRGPISG